MVLDFGLSYLKRHQRELKFIPVLLKHPCHHKNKQPDPLLLLTIDVYDPTPPADNPQEPEKLVDHELKKPQYRSVAKRGLFS